MSGLFLYCRPGFEPECAAEIQEKSSQAGLVGYIKAKADSGYVVFVTTTPEEAAQLHQLLSFSELIFARQWFVILAMRNDLPVDDRISGLLDAMQALPEPAGLLYLETPDTNAGKELSVLCRRLEQPLRKALVDSGRLTEPADAGLCIHICFLSTHAAYIGYASSQNSAVWPMGIPRLKFPGQAPSRSTLKLEEALLYFLSDRQREKMLQSGMTAVDLGASPGGWTWQLVRRNIRVIAVDNGAMAESVMATGLVEHRRVDGFKFRPEHKVDWLVCDVVEQPIRIAELMASWLVSDWCNHAIFNLKLPMKKRYPEVKRCLALIEQKLSEAGIDYILRARQLYHDREEVTVFITRQVYQRNR
ncbi:MAG: 23S rRNA (cytidine(2498)-2'-O)-methyltransferase RlmM [Gammaproteobacteria bacterium RBG_16_57_12]|nr:MAG: 23S rRNA (cytidine(2498)-2'-O)-methyltransferase RlmM [Gammaproteobacteria bacterium RBG_16_57_12]